MEKLAIKEKEKKDKEERETRRGKVRRGKAREKQAKETAALPHNCPLEKTKTQTQQHHIYFRGFLKIYMIFERKKWLEENSDEEENNTDLLGIC